MDEAATGWLSDAGGTSYPPGPWHLRGAAYLSLWRVPVRELAAAGCLPPGTRPATLLGQALVATA